MKSLVVLLCFMLLTGCGSSRNIQESYTKNESSELNELRSSLDSIQLDIQKQSQLTAERLRNLKIENKIVYLSNPDSTGKQHPIKQSITHIHQEDKEVIKQYEMLSMMFMELSGKLDTLHSMVESAHVKDTKVKKLSWWDLYKDRIFFVLILLVLFPDLYKLIKKLKNFSTT